MALSFTGRLEKASRLTAIDSDTSIFVPIELIREANAKMIELKYQKEINNNLIQIIANDSVIIDAQQNNIDVLRNTIEEIQEDNIRTETEYKSKIKKLKEDRNCYIGSSLGLFAIIILLLL